MRNGDALQQLNFNLNSNSNLNLKMRIIFDTAVHGMRHWNGMTERANVFNFIYLKKIGYEWTLGILLRVLLWIGVMPQCEMSIVCLLES